MDAVDLRQRKAREIAPSAAGLLTAAVRLLPAGHRNRYRQEYRSELWDLAQAGAGCIGQLRYAFCQLRNAPSAAVRVAVPAAQERGAMKSIVKYAGQVVAGMLPAALLVPLGRPALAAAFFLAVLVLGVICWISAARSVLTGWPG